jgi:hypothetical protein
MRNLFGMSGLTLKHGRQEFVKGSEFQFGNQSFEDGLVWDGHRIDWSNESFGITGFLFNETGEVTLVDSYTMGIYGTLKSIKDVTIDAYWINRDATSVFTPATTTAAAFTTDTRDSTDTIGGRVGGAMSGIDFNLELAFQDNNRYGDPMAFEANVGYTFSNENKLHVHGQYANLESGYTAPALDRNSNRYGFFDTLFGYYDNTRRLTNANNQVIESFIVANLESLSFGVSFDPTAAWTLGANVFFNDQDETTVIFLPALGDNSYTEIDISADYRYSDNLTMTLGLGYLMYGNDIYDDVFMGYLQARLTF